MKIKPTITNFKENQNHPGINVIHPKPNIGNHPPKNNMTVKLDINIILLYSAKKKK